ncbi:flagellar biosynthesis protein FliP (plasmid) [Rhodovastum atsumiense]|uniref:flagellar type III secretion system pore protein FliP n=1 Tax=Rhodovastum atsumiense TaxID=504468 RepID=UPI00202439F0|nr:flagellar type III secretion system pore protein FliP [Rhodovastum atsumiense]CAH2605529.1 flagellar biosynthesis protein FliP [Rhodovastum atsumiense]
MPNLLLRTLAMAMALCAPTMASAQTLSLSMPGGAQSLTTNVAGLIAITSLLALAPGLLVVGTAFTRLVVVLSLLRTALGLQQSPPNTVIIGLALFLTGFVMAPAMQTAWSDAVVPLTNGVITEEEAFLRGVKPFRSFMEANASDKDVVLFMELSGWTPPKPAATPDAAETPPNDPPRSAQPGGKSGKPNSVSRKVRSELPFSVLCPAFLISELSKAFQIGFLLFLPFLVIDIAVSAVLMGMGMMMLPPVVVSLPFKLIFFVLVDGWELVAGSLVRSFTT